MAGAWRRSAGLLIGYGLIVLGAAWIVGVGYMFVMLVLIVGWQYSGAAAIVFSVLQVGVLLLTGLFAILGGRDLIRKGRRPKD